MRVYICEMQSARRGESNSSQNQKLLKDLAMKPLESFVLLHMNEKIGNCMPLRRHCMPNAGISSTTLQGFHRGCQLFAVFASRGGYHE